MCRNIKNLFNFEPVATNEEIESAALQFVRKVSGFQKPSEANENAFNLAVGEVSNSLHKLLESLETKSEPRNRDIEAQKVKERSIKRFGK